MFFSWYFSVLWGYFDRCESVIKKGEGRGISFIIMIIFDQCSIAKLKEVTLTHSLIINLAKLIHSISLEKKKKIDFIP